MRAFGARSARKWHCGDGKDKHDHIFVTQIGQQDTQIEHPNSVWDVSLPIDCVDSDAMSKFIYFQRIY